MDPSKTKALFDDLCRYRPLKEWLQAQLDSQINTLVASNDIELLRKAQGQAQFIRMMIEKLDAAEKLAKAR